MYNAFEIDIVKNRIMPISIDLSNAKNIEKRISGFRIIPGIYEKIILDYDKDIAMVAESRNKRDKGFYFKGLFISSKAIILRINIENDKFSYLPMDINSSDEINIVKNKIYFCDNINVSQKKQIKMISNLIKSQINVFELITFFDKKSNLRTYRIIDILDDILNRNKELFDSVLKTIEVIVNSVEETKRYKIVYEQVRELCQNSNLDKI